MDELGFGNRKGQPFGGRDAAKCVVVTLEELNVPSVGGGRHCDYKIVNVGEDQAFGDEGVEGGDVDYEQKGGDRGALWGTHSNR